MPDKISSNKLSIKIDGFIIDFLNSIITQKESKTNFIFNVLNLSRLKNDNRIERKKLLNLYFDEKQLEDIEKKMEALGYDNTNKFVRRILLDYFLSNYKPPKKLESKVKLIDIKKFGRLVEKCKDKLMSGKYTSYDISKLRDNEDFKDKINIKMILGDSELMYEKHKIRLDFIEYDMLSFINEQFRIKKAEVYDDLISQSTNHYSSSSFSKDEPFVDYENYVPDINTIYYLYMYYAFTETNVFDHRSMINIKFSTNNEHAGRLLEKYTFENIINHFDDKNVIDIKNIFAEDLIDKLKENEFIDI